MAQQVLDVAPPPCTGPGNVLVSSEVNGCGGYGGGATTGNTPSTGGESSATGTGWNGQNGTGSGAGGGGGSGVNGGNGGISAAGGAGGAGATVAGGSGSNATGAGGGGGGGAHGALVTTGVNNSAPISGGGGGNGLTGLAGGGGGGGGAGGYGLVANGSGLAVTNTGASITGGNGGAGGGTGSGTVGEGGDGGRGLEFVTGSGTLMNSGTIGGGNGGTSGAAASNPGAFPEGGNGGAGAVFLNGGSMLTNSGSISGGSGGNASAGYNSLGGNGGAGVVGLNVGIANDGTIQGGNGGNGGRGGVGQGAKGGNGVSFSSGPAVTIINNGTIQGGTGGAGRTMTTPAYAAGDGAGAGGSGISASSLAIVNNIGASIVGGAGGVATAVGGAGAGGVGIIGSNLTVYNSGAISGGAGGNGQANAITFSDGSNYLELRSGYAITGNVVVQVGAGTLALGGDMPPGSTFDVSGAGAQYQGFGSFVKTGESAWQLSGSPSSTTPWTIKQGTLAISADQNLGIAGEVLTFESNPSVTTPPTLQFNGSNINLSRGVTLATDGTFDTFGNSATLSGVVAGNGALVKTGDGTLILSGANSYEGGTTITQGTLAISADQNLGVAAGGLTFQTNSAGTPPTLQFLSNVASGRAFTLATDGSFDTLANNATLSGQIAGGGGLVKTGAGTLTLTGTNVYSGGTTISAGVLQLGDGGQTGTILGNVADEGALIFNRSNRLDFGGIISGSGAVAQIGKGTTVLTGANTYAGPTTVSAGTLQAGAVNTFSPNSAHVVETAGRLDLAGFNQTVPSLVNAGSVRTGGQANTNLTVTDAYVGQGGILNLNTYLAGDGAPSDKLVIAGGIGSGSSGMLITNVGGPGSFTLSDGILVVDDLTGHTTTPDAFHLSAPVVAGPFEYTLERSSLDGSQPSDWFLRSALDCAHVPDFPACSVGPEEPHYRQEVSLDMAIQPMAMIYGRDLIDTLHERVGEQEQLVGRADLWQDPNFNGVWGRIIGQYGHRDGDPLGIYGGGPKFDYGFGGLQAGMDLYADEHRDRSRDHAGAYLAYGHGEMDVTHKLLGIEFDGGNDRFDAVSLGGYWTHFGDSGWYLDAVAQATFYDMTSSSSRGLPNGGTNGVGLAASLESGYPFDLGDGWTVEPQGQLIYQNISFDDLNDGAATVRFEDMDSLAGRIGARLSRTWSLDPDEQSKYETPARLATVWGRVNLWREFLADAKTEFSSTSGFIPFSQNLEASSIEGELGASVQLNASTSLYGNIDYETTFNGDAWTIGAKVGLRVNW